MDSAGGVRCAFNSKGKLEAQLPHEIFETSSGSISKGKEALDNYLKTRLPPSDIDGIAKIIGKSFPISKERQVFLSRTRVSRCKRSLRLSGTYKRKLGLFNLNRKGLKFEDVLPIHSCWVNYMENYIDLPYLKNICLGGDDVSLPEELYLNLWKADYHGAYITVCKSKCPSLVGIEGILIFETKSVMRLIGRDNIIRTVPKSSCEFKTRVGIFEVCFFGKNLLLRPAERSKKVKFTVQTGL